jgi:hypothetical protein
MARIPFLLDEKMFRMGLKSWVEIDYNTCSHIIWSGRTGSGKTVGAKLLLARTILLAVKEMSPVELTVIDPKSDNDFTFLEGLPRFYRGEDSLQGLKNFFDDFRKRQKGEDLSRNLKILFLDEISSLVNLVEDKKEKEATFRALSLLLSLSRSFRYSIQLATQQPSASVLGNTGTREQFGGVILLGDSGIETQGMMFDADSKKTIAEFGNIGGRGTGWMSLNGGLAKPVRVPQITNWEKLNSVIKLGLIS